MESIPHYFSDLLQLSHTFDCFHFFPSDSLRCLYTPRSWRLCWRIWGGIEHFFIPHIRPCINFFSTSTVSAASNLSFTAYFLPSSFCGGVLVDHFGFPESKIAASTYLKGGSSMRTSSLSLLLSLRMYDRMRKSPDSSIVLPLGISVLVVSRSAM